MNEDDIDKASALMPVLLDRLNGEWRQWKRRAEREAPMFDECLLPDAGEPIRSKGIRICVKKRLESPLGYWRYEGDKYIFSAHHDFSFENDPSDPHFYAAPSEDEAVRWTRSICCAPRADLRSSGSEPVAHRDPVDGLSFIMRDDATGEDITVFIRASVLQALGGYRYPADFAGSIDLFKEHRRRIEEAASEKYRAQGVLGELEGRDALWIEPSDLEL
jgi:Protein of unknown function (DUF1488)